MATTDPLGKLQAVTIHAAATSLSVNPRTLYRLIAAGEFPRPIKIGGSTRVLVADIERFILRQRSGGMS